MTAYNAQPYLRQTVQSILAQTYDGFEFVIVDDGSTDQTPQMLGALALEDPRIRVITQANAGISAAANAGLAACRGQYVARIDADDLAEPQRLEVQLQFMQAHPEVVASGSAVTFIDEAGRRLTINRPPLDHDAIDDAMMRGHCSIWNPSSIYQREVFAKLGGYDEQYRTAEDLEAWLRLAEHGRLANIDQPLQRYRIHEKSISASDQSSNREDCRRACEEAAARRGVACRFEAQTPWRAVNSRQSKRTFFTRYGWWAWRLGERKTARYYAFKALVQQPWAIDSWRLMLKSTVGSSPTLKGQG